MKKFNKFLDMLEDNFVGFCILFSTILITVNVFLRFFLGRGISWSDELVRYTIIALTFIGTSICVRTNNHIAIDILSERLKPKNKALLVLFLDGVGILFMILITKISIDMVRQSMKYPQLSPALQIDMWVPYVFITIGFALSVYRYFQKIVDDIQAFKSADTLDGR